MILGKRMQKATLIVAISVTFMTALAGCGKDKEDSPPEETAPAADNQGSQPSNEVSEPTPSEEPADSVVDPGATEPSEDETQSLEEVSAKDGEKFLAALKKKDTAALSLLMAPAENEYTEADMAKVLEGFQLYFDSLDELTLRFEANEQNDEYFIERYAIEGNKDGKARVLPFEVEYAKSQGMANIRDDAKRVTLYDSPLIGQYPYAMLEVERYVQALLEKDTESLALHLGMYDDNAETKAAVDQALKKYEESIDLGTVKVIAKGYDGQGKQFSYELRDSKQQTHELRIAGEEMKIVDDWAAVQAAQ
ncbi:hypothetical protein FHS18_006007 [Paenibacillus phyllosphaerae]|uniref:Lipoprotein n=1 Tax=Paenibacillus phyllosphaerae TaxID=274593 RepID=A0A7W5FR37_9BACL|nr:hypothetical protein [Paenibacillus phyllosphaerae]MBB3113892.1 hypothetical protein [Paenibacillus phyllosphaerae]